MNTTSLFSALSIVAVILAGVALYVSQNPSVPPTVTRGAAPAANAAALEQQVEGLVSDVESLRAQLADLERALAHAAPAGESAAKEVPADLLDLHGLKEPIARAVEAVMERNGVDYVRRAQAEAKRGGARKGMTNWFQSQQDQLPVLRQRIADKLNIDRPRREQVTEIMDTAFASMGTAIELLSADPPPSDDEADELMREVKQGFGTMVADLDEILDGEELIQLGQITLETELSGLGSAIVVQGKQELAAQQSGGG